jgi:hypothetical protein
VNKCGDVRSLLVVHFELRHCGYAIAQNIADQFTALVVQHDFGAKQIRASITASSIIAVTEGAVRAVEHLAALKRRGINWWSLWISLCN